MYSRQIHSTLVYNNFSIQRERIEVYKEICQLAEDHMDWYMLELEFKPKSAKSVKLLSTMLKSCSFTVGLLKSFEILGMAESQTCPCHQSHHHLPLWEA